MNWVVSSGLYYKYVMIINDDSSIVSKWRIKLIDDPRVIIYDRHKFITQATVLLMFMVDGSWTDVSWFTRLIKDNRGMNSLLIN